MSKGLRTTLVSVGILGGCLLLASLIVALGSKEPPPPMATPPARKVAVRTTQVVPGPVRRTVLAFGTVEAERDAQVSVETDGTVSALNVNLGSQVVRDAPLLSLDDRELAIALRQAEAELRRAEAIEHRARIEADNAKRQLLIAGETLQTRARERARWKDLAAKGMASQDRLDQAEVMLRTATASHARAEGSWDSVASVASEMVAAVDLAKANRDRAALFKSRCVVRAPFAGRVAERLVEVGDFVRRGTPVLRLVAHDRVRLRVHVGAEDALTIEPGASVEISVPGVAFATPAHYDGTGAESAPDKLQGAVVGVAASADPSSRKFAVDVEADNPLGLLREGMFARVRISAGELTEAIVIPDEAVGADGEGKFVYVCEGETVKKVRVVLGPRQDEGRILRGGLSGPAELASDGLGLLFDGAPIRRMNR